MSDGAAVRRVGPAPASQSAALNRAVRTPAAVNGSAQWVIPGTGFTSNGNVLPGCWVTITNTSLTATDLLCVSFWSTREGAHPNVATANDFVILPGATQEFWCDPGIDSVKFGGPVTAIASHYRSSIIG